MRSLKSYPQESKGSFVLKREDPVSGTTAAELLSKSETSTDASKREHNEEARLEKGQPLRTSSFSWTMRIGILLALNSRTWLASAAPSGPTKVSRLSSSRNVGFDWAHCSGSGKSLSFTPSTWINAKVVENSRATSFAPLLQSLTRRRSGRMKCSLDGWISPV
eukprot:6183212-Pleurochrysis_carterae.AAC.4